MKIRLAAISTSKNTDDILKYLKKLKNDNLQVVLHIGDSSTDYKASSITRMNTKKAAKGHLFTKNKWSGAAFSLFESSDFDINMEDFIDHLYRRSELNSYKCHQLRSIQDYKDYYFILADRISEVLIERKVTHCLFFNVPHLTYDTIVYQVANSLSLPILIISQSIFPNHFFSLANIKNFGNFLQSKSALPYNVAKGRQHKWFYMKDIKQEYEESAKLTVGSTIQFLTFLLIKQPLKMLNPFYVTKLFKHMIKINHQFPKWRDPFAIFFHENSLAYFDYLAQFEKQEINLSDRFVYFPLQLQPEMTTSALGGGFRDQAYAIECLANILPKDVRILVKENPKQNSYMRGPMFFHRLNRIKSVFFLPSWANTHELIEKSCFVATITGTAGWEALTQGKPVLAFGKAWYRKFEGVFEWQNALTFDAITSKKFDHSSIKLNAGMLLSRSHSGVIDRHYQELVPNFDQEQNNYQVAKVIWELLNGERKMTFVDTNSRYNQH
ncbi:MAG: hypothetical protein OXC62_00820 [Aestuariivita sp.]|nr:hypothetical protein [Aestuariivita sp.]